MTPIPISQLAILVSVSVRSQGNPPGIANAPVLNSVTAGSAPTYTAAYGLTGTPAPSLRHDLYKNGSVIVANYISGTSSPATAAIASGDAIYALAIATNSSGVATLASNVVNAIAPGVPSFTQQSAPNGKVSYNFPFPSPGPAGGAQAPCPDYQYWFQASNSTSYSIASGSIPPGTFFDATAGSVQGFCTTPGTYTFSIGATGISGSATSNPQTLTFGCEVTLLGTPIVGKAMGYTIRGIGEAITSQQWYRNDGVNGPVAISGATGLTYTYASGDIGYWPSVAATGASGTVYRSTEFSAKNTIISQTPVLQGVSPSNRLPGYGSLSNSYTFAAPMEVRTVNGTSYVETILAPGTYAGSIVFGLPSGNVYARINKGATAVVAARSLPATATRPAGNTGTGFFAATGGVYNPDGTRFAMRGVNKAHGDSSTPGIFQSGANVVRLWMDMKGAFTVNNKPMIDALIAAKQVPMLCFPGAYVTFTANFDGSNQMTVTALNDAGIGYLFLGMALASSSNPTYAKYTITACPGGAQIGKTGVYTVSAAVPATTGVNLGTFYKGSGQVNTALLASVAQMWADYYPNLSSYDGKIMLNVTNEWGPQASASNTVWRDTYVNLIPNILRVAGYKCPIVVDACASGQDSGQTPYGMLNHMQAIQNSDPQTNVIGSLHMYGKWSSAGSHVATINALGALAADSVNGGVPYIIGEFGPARQVDYSNVNGGVAQPLEIMSTAEGLGLAGWVYWAWDDNLYSYPTLEQDNWYSAVYNIPNGYTTKNALDLTIAGKDVVLNNPYGTAFAVPSTAL